MRRHALAVVLAAALLSAGCATRRAASTAPAAPPAPAAPAHPPVMSRAGQWEVVFPGAHVSAETQGPETSRLDQALATRTPANVIEETLWPPSGAPSLDDLRGRFISDDPRNVSYYSAYGAASTWWRFGYHWR